MTFLDDALTERITEEARQVDFGRALLAFVAAVLVFTGKVWATMVTAVAWSYVAVRTGYREVRPQRSARR